MNVNCIKHNIMWVLRIYMYTHITYALIYNMNNTNMIAMANKLGGGERVVMLLHCPGGG